MGIYTKRGLLFGFIITIMLGLSALYVSGHWYESCLNDACRSYAINTSDFLYKIYTASFFPLFFIGLDSSLYFSLSLNVFIADLLDITDFDIIIVNLISPIFFNTIFCGSIGFLIDLYLKKKRNKNI